MGPVFDKYLFLLGSGLSKGPTLFPVNRANSLVGVAESVSGITSLVAAVPVGLVVDRHPQQRSRLLRWSTVMALLAMALGFVVLITDEVLVLFAAQQQHARSQLPVDNPYIRYMCVRVCVIYRNILALWSKALEYLLDSWGSSSLNHVRSCTSSCFSCRLCEMSRFFFCVCCGGWVLPVVTRDTLTLETAS